MNVAPEQVWMRDRLLKALRALGECCYSPVQETLWPSHDLLDELNKAVKELANMKRKRPITMLTPLWKAYEFVDTKHPEIRLLSRVRDLAERAIKRLRETGESYLFRLQRKAASTRAPELRRLVECLRLVQGDLTKASKIKWEDYERAMGENKPFRLVYGIRRPGT